MIDQASALVSFHFWNAILLTVVVSLVLLAWYRWRVAQSMRSLAGTAAGAEGAMADGQIPAVGDAASAGTDGRSVDDVAAEQGRLRTRLMVVYGAGGAAAAAVSATLFLIALGDPLYPVRTFGIWYIYCWPIVPTLAAILAVPQKRALLAFGGYVLIGALIVVAWSALLRFVLGRDDSDPLDSGQSYFALLAFNAWLPFLIILVTGNRRLRSVSPFVLAGLLIFSFSNVVTGNALIAAFDYQTFRDHFTSFDGRFMRVLWYMLAALPVGYLCWRGLRWLSRQFEHRAFSDTQLLVDSWWLIVVFDQTAGFTNDFGWFGLAGLLAFVAYRSVVALGLTLRPASDFGSGGGRLLLLRVFGFQRRTERLFDVIAQRWRLQGGVKLIAGADLAMRTIDPADFIAFAGGRMQQTFVRTPRDLVGRLDDARDPDGRFRIVKFLCHEDTWRPTLNALLRQSDVVLMDLRGFSAANSGCEFELRQLAANGLLPGTVFVIDATTDVVLLESTVYEQAGEARALALNLESVTSRSAASLDRIFRRLCALAPAAGRSGPDRSVEPSPLLPATPTTS
jgi:hypothetical protein